MYILDTNVVSELRKAKSGKANKYVIKWANSVSSSSLYISVITILELEMGMLAKERQDTEQGADVTLPPVVALIPSLSITTVVPPA